MNKNNLLVVLLLALIIGAIYFFSIALEQVFFPERETNTPTTYQESYTPPEIEPALPPKPPTPAEKAARRELREAGSILPGSVADKLLNFLLSGKRDFSREMYELKYHQFDNQQQPVDSLEIELSQLAQIMLAYRELRIEVAAHTDGRGDYRQQQTISGKRADNIKTFLVNQGVPAQRINSTGHGANYPIADSDSERGRQMNERVEILISRL